MKIDQKCPHLSQTTKFYILQWGTQCESGQVLDTEAPQLCLSLHFSLHAFTEPQGQPEMGDWDLLSSKNVLNSAYVCGPLCLQVHEKPATLFKLLAKSWFGLNTDSLMQL